MTEARAGQTAKALSSMEVRLLGRETVARCPQQKKVYCPILATPSGMVMEVRLEHWQKEKLPMDVTPSGIVMEAKALQP